MQQTDRRTPNAGPLLALCKAVRVRAREGLQLAALRPEQSTLSHNRLREA